MTETAFYLGLSGTILSLLSLGWQVAQYILKSRPRMRLKACFATIEGDLIRHYDRPPSPPERKRTSHPTQMSIAIANVGEVPICLEEGGLLLTQRKRWIRRAEARIRVPPMQWTQRLPHDLARGQAYSLFAEFTVIQRELNGAPPGYRLKYMYFRDSTNKRYLKKLSRSLVEDITTWKDVLP